MQVKTISYKRVLNLGSYENKHLEISCEVFEGEDDEETVSLLMEKVERKIRESQEKGIVTQIQTLEMRVSHLKERITYYEEREQKLKYKEEELNQQQAQEPDPDDIPFESGEATQTNNQELSNF
ncbi:hypothetical protein [Nostoc sp. PA-18-2419]|uniref:hypothetical protein n=1 Tax=Nostoc sp. PA-18-2419 TaxID=2575443 RepID=UPI001109103F|nr:hypothetical protein [Nostoc sp. PA-18-2419]